MGKLKTFARVGDYVRYIPNKTSYVVPKENSGYLLDQKYNPSEAQSWRVFDCKPYGIEIISHEVRASEVELCTAEEGVVNKVEYMDDNVADLILQGEVGYRNAVSILDDFCSAYINPKYALEGRCLGRGIEAVENISGEIRYRYVRNNFGWPYMDNAFETDFQSLLREDVEWVQTFNVNYTWLASRVVARTKKNVQFGARLFCTHMLNVNTGPLLIASKQGMLERQVSGGVMPIITLKPELEIIGGKGTRENPWVIVD